MTMSLLAFCTLSLSARNEFRGDFFREEPVRRQRHAQERRSCVERPDAPPCPMDDCNEEPVAVHQEFGHQGPEVDRKARFLPRDRPREGLGGGALFPRINGTAGGTV